MNDQSSQNKNYITDVTKNHQGKGYQILSTNKKSPKYKFLKDLWLLLIRDNRGNEANSKKEKVFNIIINSLTLIGVFFTVVIVPIVLLYSLISFIVKIAIKIFS